MNRSLGFGFGLISSSNIAGDPAIATLTPTELVSATTGSGITDIPINASSATEGYLMVLLVTVWSNVSITDYPAAWNLERTGKEGSSSGQSQLYAFSKIASSSESTSYTFTVSGNLYGDRFTYSLLEIPQTGLGVRNATYSEDATLGKLYSYSNNTLHLALCGKADYSATEDVVHPTGYTELLDRTGSLHNHAIAYKEISGASRALSNGTDEFTDPDNANTTGDNNLSNIHLAISNAGSIISETYEGTGTPVGFTTTIDGSGTITFDETTTVLEGSKSLKVYNDNSATNDTYTYVDLNEEYDHMVAIFGYNITSMSNRSDVFFLDDELNFGSTSALGFGSVSSYTKGIAHAYGAISLTMTGTINNFHYVRVEIHHSGGVVKIARSNDKTFPTSGDNYAEDTSASFNSAFSGTRAIAFGTYNASQTTYYDDLEVTGEIGKATTITDDFNRSDTVLEDVATAEGWSWVNGRSDPDTMSVSSNKARVTNSNDYTIYYANYRLGTDAKVQTTVTNEWPSNTSAVNVSARYTDYDNRYTVQRSHNTDDFRLYSVVSGTSTEIGTRYTADPSVPYNMKLVCNGDQISVYLDDVLRIGPVTDTSITSGDYVGIGGYNNGSNRIEMDDFVASSLSASGDGIGITLEASAENEGHTGYSSPFNISVSYPAVSANDILVAIINTERRVDFDGTPPTGWTKVIEQDGGNAYNPTQAVYWKRATGSAAATSETWSSIMNDSEHYYAWVGAYAGCVTSGSPIDASAGSYQGYASSWSQSITTQTNNAMILTVAGTDKQDHTYTWTDGTELVDTIFNSQGTASINQKVESTSGATTRQVTPGYSVSGTMTAVALKPA